MRWAAGESLCSSYCWWQLQDGGSDSTVGAKSQQKRDHNKKHSNCKDQHFIQKSVPTGQLQYWGGCQKSSDWFGWTYKRTEIKYDTSALPQLELQWHSRQPPAGHGPCGSWPEDSSRDHKWPHSAHRPLLPRESNLQFQQSRKNKITLCIHRGKSFCLWKRSSLASLG